MLPGQLRVVFKHQPLSFHDRAKPAAVASMAAHKQGKFWKFHDLVFENSKALSDADLRRSARRAGLDMGQYEKDILDKAVIRLVDADMLEAQRIRVGGTPTLYLNGRKVKLANRTAQGIVDLVKSKVLKID